LQNTELMTEGQNLKLKRRSLAKESQESRRQRPQRRRTGESKEERQPPLYQQLRGLREPQLDARRPSLARRRYAMLQGSCRCQGRTTSSAGLHQSPPYQQLRSLREPQPLEIIEKLVPVRRQMVNLEISQRKREAVVDADNRRRVLTQPRHKPFRDPRDGSSICAAMAAAALRSATYCLLPRRHAAP